ncbi:BF3164 family lipoprotein [Roseivirga sp.]|uniref:BF3164 family lipoprotein n=1 Tax=Roseivirga sp. TaxID=1964215 RepID=UPI003B8DD4C1
MIKKSAYKMLLILIIGQLLQGCDISQSSDNTIYEIFPKNESLKHSKVRISEALTPSSIHLVNDIVVLIDKNLDYSIRFYEISNWSLKGKYGRRGDGPAEMQRPKFHGQYILSKNETNLWFSDIRSYKLKKISLEKMIGDINTEPELTHTLPPELALAYKDVFSISDDEFVGTIEGDIIGLSGDPNAGRFFQFSGKDIKWTPNFPKQDLEVPQEKVGYLYSSRSAFNNNTQQLASAMLYYDRIDIMDFRSHEVLTVMSNDKSKLKEVDLRDDHSLIPPDTKHYYIGAYGTENYFYCLYAGTTTQQARDFIDGNNSEYPNLQLHVFDWKGNPIYKAHLDKWTLPSFFIDEKSWKLYAIDGMPEEEEEVIISYDLPNLLDEKNQ